MDFLNYTKRSLTKNYFMRKYYNQFNSKAATVYCWMISALFYLATASTVNAQAVPVTFRVDMSQQSVDPNGVHVAGSFQGWNPGGSVLNPVGGGIYENTFMINPEAIEYKFINGNTWGQDEGVPFDCQVGGNRGFNVPAGGGVIPVVCFGQCDACPALVNVTFQVDMNEQTVSGAGVHIAGNFQGWDLGSTQMTHVGGGIYTYTATILEGYEVFYKYINGNQWSDNEIVPGACNNSGNRFYTVPTGGATLPLVCFSSCIACAPVMVNVTFQVNMSNQIVSGSGVHIAGDFQGFNPGTTPMTHIGGNIYTYTTSLAQGDSYQYKYINGNAWGQDESVPGPCNFSGNRQITVPVGGGTIPAVCYGECINCAPPVSVTFQVDLSQQIISGAGVHIAGSFQGWNPGSTPMTHIGGGVYTYTATVSEGATIEYKFINGNDWPQAEGVPGACEVFSNRQYVVPVGGGSIPVVCFASCTACPPPVPNYNITFRVDMSNQVVGSGVFFAYNGNGFSNAANPMTPIGGNVYSITLSLPQGSNILYKFVNETTYENGDSGCGVNDGFGGYNRTYTVPANNTTLPTVCFNQCGACSLGNTWTSVGSGNWNNGSIWNQGTTPDAGADIVIAAGHSVTLNVAANIGTVNINNNATLIAAENLNIANGGSVLGLLRVSQNRVLGATGGVLDASGAGRIQLDNGASLLHGSGTIGGGGTVTGNFRVLRQGYTGLGYSFMSAPMDNVNVSTLGNFRYFYDPFTAILNPSNNAFNPGWQTASGNMEVARGYAIQNPGLAVLNGVNPREGTLNYVVRRANAPNHFINLVGNPFPSAISANDFINSNGPAGTGAISGTIYFWDDPATAGGYTSNDYAYWNGAGSVGGGGNMPNGQIGSCQGFFVEALIDNQTISFMNNWRTGNNTQFFNTPSHTTIRLNVTNEANHYNEMLIAFKEDATEGFDILYDARKIITNSNLSMFSKMGDERFAIQALPELTHSKVVELGIISSSTSLHTLKMSEIVNLDATVQVYLEDKELETFTNLRTSNEYHFQQGTQSLETRFAIHFSEPLEVSHANVACEQLGSVTIVNEQTELINYQIANASNEIIAEGTLNQGTNTIVELSAGIYTLNYTWNNGYVAQDFVEIEGVQILSDAQALPESIEINQGSLLMLSKEIAGADNFSWFVDGELIAESETFSYTFDIAGTYQISFLASSSDCQLTDLTYAVVKADETTSIFNLKNEVKLYPNPANELFNISSDQLVGKNLAIKIYDAMQRLVINEVISQFSGTKTIGLDGLDAGIYFVNLQAEGINSSSRLVIVK